MGIDFQRDERRGEDARQILESGLYKESWAALRENIVAKLEQADLKPDERQRCNDLLIVHGKAKKYLEQALMTGTMAAMEMERQRTLAERIKDRVKGRYR